MITKERFEELELEIKKFRRLRKHQDILDYNEYKEYVTNNTRSEDLYTLSTY